jgi:hypothetical protein
LADFSSQPPSSPRQQKNGVFCATPCVSVNYISLPGLFRGAGPGFYSPEMRFANRTWDAIRKGQNASA